MRVAHSHAARRAFLTPRADRPLCAPSPPQLELRKLEDRLSAVQREMQYQREREESHRDLSEVTNGRVVLFSWLTIVIVVVQGMLQVWYLYAYFRRIKCL